MDNSLVLDDKVVYEEVSVREDVDKELLVTEPGDVVISDELNNDDVVVNIGLDVK